MEESTVSTASKVCSGASNDKDFIRPRRARGKENSISLSTTVLHLDEEYTRSAVEFEDDELFIKSLVTRLESVLHSHRFAHSSYGLQLQERRSIVIARITKFLGKSKKGGIDTTHKEPAQNSG